MQRVRRYLTLTVVAVALLGYVTGSNSSQVLVNATSVAGPVQFLEIYFLSGKDSERRMPSVGEEFRVAAHIRNVGSVVSTICQLSVIPRFQPRLTPSSLGSRLVGRDAWRFQCPPR